MTTLHPPSTSPVWLEEFNLPLRATPTAIVLRVFDRDFSNDSEVRLHIHSGRLQIQSSFITVFLSRERDGVAVSTPHTSTPRMPHVRDALTQDNRI